MKSLKSTTENKNSSTTLNNRVVYTINIVNSSVAFYTDTIGHDTGSRVDYLIIGDSISGTGTLTLQWSADGENFYDAQDSEGSAITVTLSSALNQEYVIDNLAGLQTGRWKISGSNTAGTIQIFAVPK